MLPPGSLVENQSFWVKNIHFRLIEPIMNQFHVFEKNWTLLISGMGKMVYFRQNTSKLNYTWAVYRYMILSPVILHRRYKIEHLKGWYEVNSKMAGWHVVEKYLEEVGKHSTLIGKYWITMFLVLRKGYYIDNHLDSNWTVLNSKTVKKRQKTSNPSSDC